MTHHADPPLDRTTLLEQIHAARTQLDAVLARIPAARMEEVGAVGTWSIKDVLSHIAWYENETAGLLEQRAVVGSEWWSLGIEAMNQRVYEAHQDVPLATVQAHAAAAFARLVAAVETLSEEKLRDPAHFREMPAEWVPGRMIYENSAEHYLDHMADIEAWWAEKSSHE